MTSGDLDRRAATKSRPLAAFLASALLGALIWALSPALAGRAEPWDADGLYYLIALAAGGVVAGRLVPRPAWAHFIGAIAGQAIYELLFLEIGALFALGVLFLCIYSVLFLATAAIAGWLRARCAAGMGRRHHHRS